MKFHHVTLTVKDLTTTISFYGEFLGFREIKRFRRDDMKATGCLIQNENVIIELWEFDVKKDGTREDLSFTGLKHLGFIDDNPAKIRDLFLSKGVDCGEKNVGPGGGIYFFFSDPDGNQMEIYKPKV